MAIYIYRQIPKCEKCGYELKYSNIPSQNGRSMFIFTPEINDKIQACEKCGYKYESNNDSFDDLSIMQKVLYLIGFSSLPDFDAIKQIHSKPNPAIFTLYFVAPMYWYLLIFINIFLIFPLRIPSHLYKAMKYSDKTTKLFIETHKEKNHESFVEIILLILFHVFSILFIPLMFISLNTFYFLAMYMFLTPTLILLLKKY